MNCVIGIPTVNNPERLSACLKSIFDTSDAKLRQYDCKVIVVDDGSDLENLEKNKEICSIWGVDLLMHGDRRGVPKAWNTLTNHYAHTSKYTILLNDDIIVTYGWLDAILYSLQNNESIGVIGFNAYEGPGSYFDGEYIMSPTYNESRLLHGSYGSPVLSVRGFAFGFRTFEWTAIGGFDERFFCFFEEIDFCLSMLSKLNKRCAILSSPILKHYHGATTVKILNNPQEILYESKSKFEEKWQTKFEDLRQMFNHDTIPEFPTKVYEWNTNVGIWF